jgi:endonuclease/exonuclease/phosphatase (EEP) superfamily protein YafD
VNAIPVARLYLPPPAETDVRGEEPHLRLMLLNVNAANTNHSAVARAIDEGDADVVVLEEITPAWIAGLSTHLASYRFAHYQPRVDCFGIGLLSRIRGTDCVTTYIGPDEIPSLVARVPVGAQILTVVATHPLPPANGRYSRSRNGHLAALPDAMADLARPLVLIGDLNTTAWSHHFSRLLRDADLRNSQQGFGHQRSWPAGRMLMGISIDHLLHSPEIGIADRRIGPAVGSDHHPVTVDLVLLEPPEIAQDTTPAGPARLAGETDTP